MIPMKILGLTMDGKAPVLVLQQDGGSEVLPIWIGTSEALAISIAINQTELDRPLTHDTMFRVIEALGAEVIGLDVMALRDGAYHAELELSSGGRTVRLDCRPSDGIALAVRGDAPIRVSPAVLEQIASTRSRHRGEDLVTSFMPENPTEQALARLLPGMEAASPYKM